MPKKLNILLIGFGNMGQALYHGWHQQDHQIYVVDPAVEKSQNPDYFFNHVNDEINAFKADFVVLAVKPQIIDQVLSEYDFLKGTKTPVISIMAGVSTEKIMNYFGDGTPIIRAMPNTPAMVGQGMTVCYPNQYTHKTQIKNIDHLMHVVGHVAWIDDEKDMHTVTALSGSGPAYLFYLIQSMAQAGMDNGLNKDLAVTLARQTIIGAAELVKLSDQSVETLRQSVTSPGGTTQAALDILMDKDRGLKTLMEQAISAATQRSKDLS